MVVKFFLGEVSSVWFLTKIWSHVFLTAALGGCDWSDSRPGRSFPGKEFRHPSDRRMYGRGKRSEPFRDQKLLSPIPAFEPRLVEPIFYSVSYWAGWPNICETYFSGKKSLQAQSTVNIPCIVVLKQSKQPGSPVFFLALVQLSCMREKRGVYRVLVVKPEGKRPLGRPRLGLEDINL